MEPITLTAALIAALFSGAASRVGETGATELIDYVRQKFRNEDKEALLDKAKDEQELVKAELVEQMIDDQEYRNYLEKSLESIGITRQVVLTDIKTQAGIDVEDISVEDYDSSLLEQIVLSHLHSAKDIKVKGVHIKSQKKTLHQ